jgi:predicted nucleic-acid-binding Zn-ribbon protein
MTRPDGETYGGIMILQCPKCQHEWLEKAELPMLVDAWLARAKGWEVCPNCGNKKNTLMLLGEKFKEAYMRLRK